MSRPGIILPLLTLVALVLGPGNPVLAQDHAAATKNKVQNKQQQALELYQLPWSLRHDLPPIKITVLHAPSEPDLRFVKINGERFSQGDSMELGPRIVEIRTDGVILEFQGQRLIVRLL